MGTVDFTPALALLGVVVAIAVPRLSHHREPPAAVGQVVVDTMWSQSLGVRKQLVVYLPPSYERERARRFPVAFYLHGLEGDEWNWVRNGHLDKTLDSLITAGMPEMIVVMPDGDDGWYTTWNWLGDWPACRRETWRHRHDPKSPVSAEPAASYCVPWTHYDDYVARDIVAHVDSAFRTVASREHRGIAGLSMGGYGAVSLALSYPEVFAAAASHSGILSPLYVGPHPFAQPARYASDEETLRQAAGSLWWSMAPAFGHDTVAWWARDPGRMARRLRSRPGAPMPALEVDVGRDDPYVDQSRAFHATLLQLGVSHEYAEWPGTHDWRYWRAHAVESLRWLATKIR